MIDKTFDDLQAALSRVKVLENRLTEAYRDRDRYAGEVQRLRSLGLGGGIVFDSDTREVAP